MLSLREHIALRTVERSFAERAAGAEAWDRLCVDIDAAISPLFAKGRKLRDGEVDRIADRALARLDELLPLVVLDHRRAATRAKPKGEMREILCVASNAGNESGQRFVEVCTIRVLLSRKRAAIEAGSTAMRITDHAMQRSIERGVIEAADGVEHRFALQMLDHAGIVVMGRTLLGTGDLSWEDSMPLPFDDGLILGGFRQGEDTTFDRVVYDAGGRYPSPTQPSTLLTAPHEPGDAVAGLAVYRGATVIGCSEMTSNQGELWDAMRRFWSRHREVINVVGEALLWPGATLRPAPDLDAMAPAYADAVAGLRDILHDPLLQARRGARTLPRRWVPGYGQPEHDEPVAVPEPIPVE